MKTASIAVSITTNNKKCTDKGILMKLDYKIGLGLLVVFLYALSFSIAGAAEGEGKPFSFDDSWNEEN